MNNFFEFIISLFRKKEPQKDIYIPDATINELVVTPNKIIPMEPTITNSEHLYDVAYSLLKPAQDVSPKDIAPDDLACAESVYDVLNRAFPNSVGFSLTISTITLCKGLVESNLYKEIFTEEKGAIIVCVSGTGKITMPHGHTGIVGRAWIMSNNSRTGNWEANYTFESWREIFEVQGGFKSRFFMRI